MGLGRNLSRIGLGRCIVCLVTVIVTAIVAACAEETPGASQGSTPVTVQPGTASSLSATSSSPSGPSSSLSASALYGHLIAIAQTSQAPDGKPGLRNVAYRVSLSSGAQTPLWATDKHDVRATEWRFSPDGQRVAYRRTVAMGTPGDDLIVQALQPDAQPVVVASHKPTEANVQGLTWSGFSDSLAYGLRVGRPISDSGVAGEPIMQPLGWELHILTSPAVMGDTSPPLAENSGLPPFPAPEDRTAWRLSENEMGDQALTLVAWDAASATAAVAVTDRDGGSVNALRLIDERRGTEVKRVALQSKLLDLVASPDGRTLAWPKGGDATDGVIQMDLRDGNAGEGLVEPGAHFGLMWSTDNRALGWVQEVTAGTVATRRISVKTWDEFNGQIWLHTWRLKEGAGRILAFSPDGALALVGTSPDGIAPWSQLWVWKWQMPQDGTLTPPPTAPSSALDDPVTPGWATKLDWTLPDGTYQIAWVR